MDTTDVALAVARAFEKLGIAYFLGLTGELGAGRASLDLVPRGREQPVP